MPNNDRYYLQLYYLGLIDAQTLIRWTQQRREGR
jgi:hypothetical protein